MNYLRLALVSILALTGVACGGTGSQTTTTSGSGGSGTSSASAGTGGSAAASTSAASSGGTGGQGTGGQGTGGAGPCVGNISLAIDNKALQIFSFECAGDTDANQATTPVGYQFAGNLPGAPQGLRIVGCKTAAAGSEGVVLSAFDAHDVGTYTMGLPQYTDAGGMVSGKGDDPFNMVVTALGPLGQPIDGTFTATSTSGAVSHSLTGSFHVCHSADFLPP
jgi:hypothetical protein